MPYMSKIIMVNKIYASISIILSFLLLTQYLSILVFMHKAFVISDYMFRCSSKLFLSLFPFLLFSFGSMFLYGIYQKYALWVLTLCYLLCSAIVLQLQFSVLYTVLILMSVYGLYLVGRIRAVLN